MISRQQRYAIELLIVSSLNGIYLMIVGIILYFLVLSRRNLTLPRKITFGITVLMYLLSSACLACVFAQSLRLQDSTIWTTWGTAFGVTNVLFAELILLWRVWVVWACRRWVVVLPSLSISITAALGYYATWKSSDKRFGDLFQVISLLSIAANNIGSTILIAARIWYLQRKMVKAVGQGRTISRAPIYIAGVVIESGALYSGLYICGILLFRWSSVAVTIILAILTQMAGVLPAIIMLLVHLDMVPGSQINREYNDMIVQSQAARGSDLPVLDIRREFASTTPSTSLPRSSTCDIAPPCESVDSLDRRLGTSYDKGYFRESI